MSYHRAAQALSVVIAALGILVLVVTLASGGGPASVGFLMGIALVGVGAGRFWIARRMQR